MVRATSQRWWTLAVTCLVSLLSNGLTLAGITVFDESLLAELSISRAELKFRDLVQMCTAAGAAPLLGFLADRWGVRPLMLFGLMLLSAGFFGYAKIDSITQVYYLHVLLGLGLSSTGIILCVSVVSRWFLARRGLALGLVLGGASVGNGILPLLNSALNDAFGWRGALFILAFLPIIAASLVLLLVKERPSKSDRAADGGEQSETKLPKEAGAYRTSYWKVFRDRNFLLLALIAFCTFLSLVGITAHMFLYFRGLSFSVTHAASALTLLYAMAISGKLAAGVMADRWGVKFAFTAYLAVMTLGAWLLASPVYVLPWIAVAVLGLGWGGTYTLQQLTATALFSGPSLGKIVGLLVLVDSLGAALGPWGIGYAYDRFDSYRAPFAMLVLLIGCSFVASLFLRHSPRENVTLSHT